MKDEIKSVLSQVGDRFTSPIFGSFVISWLLWNHRYLVILFSDLQMEYRFLLIQRTLYPDAWAIAWRGFLAPAAMSALYIGFYSDVSRKILEFWDRRQKRLLEARIDAQKRPQLTIEESKKLWARVEDLEQERRTWNDLNNVLQLQLKEARAEQVAMQARDLDKAVKEHPHTKGIATALEDFKKQVVQLQFEIEFGGKMKARKGIPRALRLIFEGLKSRGGSMSDDPEARKALRGESNLDDFNDAWAMAVKNGWIDPFQGTIELMEKGRMIAEKIRTLNYG